MTPTTEYVIGGLVFLLGSGGAVIVYLVKIGSEYGTMKSDISHLWDYIHKELPAKYVSRSEFDLFMREQASQWQSVERTLGQIEGAIQNRKLNGSDERRSRRSPSRP